MAYGTVSQFPSGPTGGMIFIRSSAPLPAVEAVQSEESVRGLLAGLLGNTRIVRDLESATVAWRESNGAHHFVTLSGEQLSQQGVYTGGYANGNSDGKAPASILGRTNQIAELRASLAILQQEVT